jgi:hypothetical protein
MRIPADRCCDGMVTRRVERLAAESVVAPPSSPAKGGGTRVRPGPQLHCEMDVILPPTAPCSPVIPCCRAEFWKRRTAGVGRVPPLRSGPGFARRRQRNDRCQRRRAPGAPCLAADLKKISAGAPVSRPFGRESLTRIVAFRPPSAAPPDRRRNPEGCGETRYESARTSVRLEEEDRGCGMRSRRRSTTADGSRVRRGAGNTKKAAGERSRRPSSFWQLPCSARASPLGPRVLDLSACPGATCAGAFRVRAGRFGGGGLQGRGNCPPPGKGARFSSSEDNASTGRPAVPYNGGESTGFTHG